MLEIINYLKRFTTEENETHVSKKNSQVLEHPGDIIHFSALKTKKQIV